MKKLFFLSALAGLFVLLGSNTMLAQQNVGNRTNCSVDMKFQYGDPVTCVVAGTMSITVPPLTAIPLVLPAGTEIIRAKGKYSAPGCGAFYVGVPCSGYPSSDFVACGALCGDYKARLTSSWGLVVYN